jgi:hypothetical protein
MIENSPASPLADAAYRILAKLPLALDWSFVLELIRVATLDLEASARHESNGRGCGWDVARQAK